MAQGRNFFSCEISVSKIRTKCQWPLRTHTELNLLPQNSGKLCRHKVKPQLSFLWGINLAFMHVLTKKFTLTPGCGYARRNRQTQLRVRQLKSRLSAILVPQWWNELPMNIRTAETLHIFCCRLETHLLTLHLGPQQKSLSLCKCSTYLMKLTFAMLGCIHTVERPYCKSLWKKGVT